MENKPALTTKGRYRLKYRGTECLNCGHPLSLTDKFCPDCSQANSTKKLSIKDFIDEFFASLISYDSKLLKTLSALLLRPGKITRDYINGKRVSYTNPFRFLLSLAIIYFLMINFTGNFSEWDKYGTTGTEDPINEFMHLNLRFTIGQQQTRLVSQQLDSIRQLKEYRAFIEKTKVRDSIIIADPSNYFKGLKNEPFESRLNSKRIFFTVLLQKDAIYDLGDAIEKYGIEDDLETKMAFNLTNGFLKLQRNPGSFISTMISKLPFAIFFFLPFFALFIWFVYIRKKYTYTDHLIFSFHNTALLFILLIISYLIDSIFDVNSNWVFLSIFSIYLFQAMVKFYRQGIFKTVVKYLFLNAIFFILALLGTLTLFAGNIFTY